MWAKAVYVFQEIQEYFIHFSQNDVLLNASGRTQTFQERAVVELENDLTEREKAYLSVPMTCSQVQRMNTQQISDEQFIFSPLAHH